MNETEHEIASPEKSVSCAICLSPVAHGEAETKCGECDALYHAECWQENGGCAVYGCSQVPVIEQRNALEIPVSYWGQENKPCPDCGQQILAAAVRCRHCGATFASARPEDSAEFQRRTELEQRSPKLRKTIVWLFILCVLPCLAPVGVVFGWVWYPSRREEIKALPAIYGALCKVGLGVGITQILALVVMTIMFIFLRQV